MTVLAWCDRCDQMTPLETCRDCGLDALCGNCGFCDSTVCLADIYGGHYDFGDEDDDL
jgi:hypothetical protein